jgi:multiple sugar transport system ATP-binding protein
VGPLEGTNASARLNPERIHVFDANGVAIHHPTFR